jgi:hypothetical protein
MITLLSNWMLLKNMRILPFLLLPAICLAQDPGPSVEVQRDYNSLIVAQVKRIPEGGTYAANKLAIVRLRSAGLFRVGQVFHHPQDTLPQLLFRRHLSRICPHPGRTAPTGKTHL